MGNVKRVLYVNSEMVPYLPDSWIGNIGRYLPQGTLERKHEIRSFMPRYGCVNERRNQLHEVIRLSRMNIIVGDVEATLLIKVASIQMARMQVYFIDNEDYFKRKQLYRDSDGVFFKDNIERAVFFARGVLESVKKLKWSPDVIHCSGWITHFLPLYLRKMFADNPLFSKSKVVLSLYDDTPQEVFEGDVQKNVSNSFCDLNDVNFPSSFDGKALARLAIDYSDGIIFGSSSVDPSLVEYSNQSGLPVLNFEESKFDAARSYIDDYNNFYEIV